MSNLAEKLPKFVRDRVDALEARGRKLADQYIPTTVTAPLRGEDGVTLRALREAAHAAREEIEARVRGRKEDIADGEKVEVPVEEEAEEKAEVPVAAKAEEKAEAPPEEKAEEKPAPKKKPAPRKKPAAAKPRKKPAPAEG